MPNDPKASFAPGATIGILGGGQLGRMTAFAAQQMGYHCHIYCPEAGAPGAEVSGAATKAAYDDEAALTAFAEAVDLVTFEFENIPSGAAAFLAARRPLRPRLEVLEICQDRLREKSFCQGIGIATAPFAPVDSAAELEAALARIGRPAVLKTNRMGYDGKGQVTIGAESDPAEAWQALSGKQASGGKAGALGILEGFVAFRLELSVLVARSPAGEVACFVPVENRHRNHILDQTIAPAELPEGVADEAETIAKKIAKEIDLEGILAVEMFLDRDNRILVNELAPRPHNSGHWTIDACITSQFEQFVRAITGLPLGLAERHSDAVMKNLLGDEVEAWPEIVKEPQAKLHLYGKREARPGRKMGHVTRLFPKSD